MIILELNEIVEIFIMPKKYWWLKLKDNFFVQPKIKKLRRIAGGDTYTCIYLKLMLMTIQNDGILEFEGIEKDLEEELALKLDEDVTNIRVTLNYLASQNLLIKLDDNNFQISEVQSLIGSETAAAERKRKERATKSVTLSHISHTQVTNCHTEIEKEKELEKDSLGKESVFFKSVSSFKSHFLTKNKDEVFYTVGLGYESTTPFIFNEGGLIVNSVNNKILNSEDAYKVWNYLFNYYKNQKGA